MNNLETNLTKLVSNLYLLVLCFLDRVFYQICHLSKFGKTDEALELLLDVFLGNKQIYVTSELCVDFKKLEFLSNSHFSFDNKIQICEFNECEFADTNEIMCCDFMIFREFLLAKYDEIFQEIKQLVLIHGEYEVAYDMLFSIVNCDFVVVPTLQICVELEKILPKNNKIISSKFDELVKSVES